MGTTASVGDSDGFEFAGGGKLGALPGVMAMAMVHRQRADIASRKRIVFCNGVIFFMLIFYHKSGY
jgi:F0F1-type ATP synthase assembly protein I